MRQPPLSSARSTRDVADPRERSGDDFRPTGSDAVGQSGERRALPPSATSISSLIGSSKYVAIADDSQKDEDNAAWVMFLPEEPRRDFIELISWIRQIDRMAENEWTEGWGSRFQIFKIGWRMLLVMRLVLPEDYHYELLSRMRRRWFSRRRKGDAARAMAAEADHISAVHAWDEYVEATAEYHRSNMGFESIAEYEWMLQHLGGSFFQVLSYLSDRQRQAVRWFGMVDLFFNHLRDLPEDTAQGLCYFPADVLDRFGVERGEVLDGSCCQTPGFVHMMRFWLDDYMPHLYRRAADFLNDGSLHYTWRILRHWFLRRHARLSRALRACDMDFRAATAMYYAEVKPNRMSWVEESFAAAGCSQLLRDAQLSSDSAVAVSVSTASSPASAMSIGLEGQSSDELPQLLSSNDEWAPISTSSPIPSAPNGVSGLAEPPQQGGSLLLLSRPRTRRHTVR